MQRFELGQQCIVKPVTFNSGNEQFPKTDRGTIVYIHPRLRYVLVGVDTPGGQLRECFFPGQVIRIDRQKKRKR